MEKNTLFRKIMNAVKMAVIKPSTCHICADLVTYMQYYYIEYGPLDNSNLIIWSGFAWIYW